MGYDLSDARLQAIAYSLGIDRATSSMTQAEKAQLRYYAIMTQVTSAQGDMARTLSAPSNQLRIFQAQLTMVGRAIGNIFIPALNAILPVAIAVMQAIRGVATAIASLFGYSLPEVSYTAGLDSVTDSANNAAGGLGNAAGAAKKLKNYLMGFDELNVIPDQSSGGGGGGSGGVGGGVMSGFDFELPEYDFLADAVESNVDRIYKKIEPVVTWIKDNLDLIGTLALTAGGALLSWKLSTAAIASFNSGLTLISSIASVAATLATLGITVGLVYSFDTTFLETGDATSLIGDGLSTLLGSAIAGGTVSAAVGKVAGAGAGNTAGMYTAGVTLLISAATSIVATYKDAYLDAGWDSNTVWMTLISSIKGSLGAAAIGFAVAGGPGTAAGAIIGLIATAAISMAVTVHGIDKGAITKRVQWGDVHATAEEIRGIAESMFAVDIEPIISVSDAQVQSVTDAQATLQDTLDDFEAGLNLIVLGVDTSPEALSAMGSQADTLINDLTALIAEREEAVNVAMTIVPALDGEGNDISGDITGAIGISSAILTDGVNAIGVELGKVLSEGMSDGFSEDEILRATELLGSISRIAEAVATGEAKVAFESKTYGLGLDRLDKESVLGVVDEYLVMEDELRKSLEASAWAAKGAMEGNLAGLQQQLAEYGDTLSPEEIAAIQAQINALTAQLATWTLEDSVNEKLKEITTPMREKFTTFFQETFGTVVAGNAELGTSWASELVESLGGDLDSPESMRTLTTNVENLIDNALYTALGEENYNLAINMAESLGFTGWDLLGVELQTSLYNTLAEAAGANKTNELFKVLGYSIPTAIQTGIDNAGGVEVPEIPAPDVTPLITGLAASMATVETDVAIKLGSSWAREWVDSFGGDLDSPEAMRTLATDVENMINSALYTALGAEDYAMTVNAAEAFGLTGWDLLAADVQTNLYNTLAEAIGNDKATELFESLGYSIPGAIQTGIDSAGPVDVEVSTSTTSSSTTSGSSANLTSLGLAASSLAITAASQVASVQTQFDSAVSSAQSAADTIKASWGEVGSYMQTDVVDPIADGFTGINWNGIGKDAARGLRAGLMSIKLPNFSVKWSTKQQSFSLYGQEMTLSIPLPKISFYAGGGFPDSGELFMANENGASELVGRIGNRSAVANQDQIGDAIFQYMDAHAEENGMDEERLAAAMVSAMRSAGIGSVYIDGRRITQAINRESQRSGKPALNY